jgi:hypothetical protein
MRRRTRRGRGGKKKKVVVIRMYNTYLLEENLRWYLWT